MENNVVLRFDGENFERSCIDGFKIVIKRINITLEDIKMVTNTLEEEGYYVENFRLKGDDILEINGGMEDMAHIGCIYDLVHEVEEEKNMLVQILYRLMYLNIEITICVSGLY